MEDLRVNEEAVEVVEECVNAETSTLSTDLSLGPL